METMTIVLIVSLAINVFFLVGKYLNYRKGVKLERKRESFNRVERELVMTPAGFKLWSENNHCASYFINESKFGKGYLDVTIFEDPKPDRSEMFDFNVDKVSGRLYPRKDHPLYDPLCFKSRYYSGTEEDLQYDDEMYYIEDTSPYSLQKQLNAAIAKEDYKEAANIKSIAYERGINLES
jgi:hypothetical protein